MTSLIIAGVAEVLARRSSATLCGAGLALVDSVDAATLERCVGDASAVLEPFSATTMPAAELLGVVYESLLESDNRRRDGAHYTPSAVASRLVAIVIDGWSQPIASVEGSGPLVLDPAMGGGAFLVAAARQLASSGGPWRFDRLAGRDIDPTAVMVTEAALALLAIEFGVPPATANAADLVVADALVEPLPVADCVVGNPPFQNQLRESTVNDGARRAFLKERFGAAATAYTDSASLFLLAALDALAPGGRMSLIQPQSLLASRDASVTRRLLVERATMLGMWFSAEPVFDASVRVCAPLITRGGRADSLQRWTGPAVDPASNLTLDEPIAANWGYLVADLAGIPPVSLTRSGHRLDSIASATAGFRDQFYGFVPHTREQEAPTDPDPWLVTVGMIDPLVQRWGTASFRFAKTSWKRPVVDMASLESADAALATWAHDRLCPKVVVATQTKVVEVAVDAEGRWLPVTPGISVEPRDPADVWRLAALLSAPEISAHLHIAGLGTALSVDAMKMSASALEALPLPVDAGAWTEGAELTKAAVAAAAGGDPDQWSKLLYNLGTVMQRAYGSESSAVQAWWMNRLPRWRIPAASGPAV